MDAFANRVKTFDAFPKVDSQHTVRSDRGGFSTILTVFLTLVIIWIEIGGFLGGYVDHQFIVDDQIRTNLLINIDMLVAMPCDFIHTNVVDITDDRFLAGETLNFEGTRFFLPEMFKINNENTEYETPDLDHVMQENLRAEFSIEGQRMNQGAPACHIFGSIPVNQVSGEFHITAKGFGYRDRQSAAPQNLNFSHVISEFSFGTFYPLIDNPLDFTGKVTEENYQAYKYYAKVVPTTYEKLGIVIDTNQYSLTEQHKVIKPKKTGNPQSPPGIFFKYDFEPIKLLIAERRIPFIQFVAKLGTICGGLMILAGYLFKLYEKLLRLLFGRKFTERDTEKKTGGLLDNEKTDIRKDY
ncbi:ER-derived vesicles protein Erv41p [[Candida] jaroonii]|uniref:ER-derived vesicles protein Erv41p n=1 Tax=[Candida] jaroonii TaxID=467808 RepID=A0ACA9Y0Z1_9ASCO|nr:ER-derived vesicles protein Erv41p [[Candida] jaroonii]